MSARVVEHAHLRAVRAREESTATLSVKLHPPEAEAGTVRRPRLLEAVDRGLEAGTLVVSAPAGSGKTTLLAAWARERSRGPRVAWVTLGQTERDPVRFLDYVLAALDSALADTGITLRSSVLPVPREVDEPYLVAVAQRLAGVTDEVLVVLDDYQHVVGSATERFLRRILRHPLQHLRLVVLSRREPSLGQTKLRLRGQLRELGPGDLALTQDETADLLRLHGTFPTADQVASLHRQTLGWAAGLRALTTALPDLPDAEVGQATAAARQLAADYLDAEVLSRQTPAMRVFLRRVAIVDTVCGELADALTGGNGGAGTLADLHRERLFLEPVLTGTDEQCAWYRWNPLFAAVLRDELRGDAHRAAELHLTAAEWLRNHGRPVAAVRHALAAGAVDTAAGVLADGWFALAAAGEADSVRSLLPLFDEQRLATDPELVVISAFVALLDRDLTGAAALARKAQQGAVTLPSRRRFGVEVTAVAVRLRCAGMSGRPDTDDLYPSTLALLEQMAAEHRGVTREDRTRRALLLHALGTFELSQWRYDDAADHLSDAMTEAATLGVGHLMPRVRAQLATVELFTGRLDLARSGARDVIAAARDGDRPGAQSLGAAHLAVATVDLHRGSPESALDALERARAAVQPMDRVNRFRVHLLRHAALLLQGRTAEAEDSLEELHESATRWEAPAWVRLLEAAADADQLRVTGRPERALGLLESTAGLATEPHPSRVWRHAYAELLLDVGRPDEARAFVEQVVAEGGDRPLGVQALVLDSLAADALGLAEESLLSLTQAVRLSRREHVVRPFLLRASQVRPRLEALLEAGTCHEDYVGELLARLPAPDRAEDASPLPEPLTAREIEVLRAMQGASTNEQMAGQMFISLNTLRSHIKQINRKLGSSSRHEAVARAHRLGLI